MSLWGDDPNYVSEQMFWSRYGTHVWVGIFAIAIVIIILGATGVIL